MSVVSALPDTAVVPRRFASARALLAELDRRGIALSTSPTSIRSISGVKEVRAIWASKGMGEALWEEIRRFKPELLSLIDSRG